MSNRTILEHIEADLAAYLAAGDFTLDAAEQVREELLAKFEALEGIPYSVIQEFRYVTYRLEEYAQHLHEAKQLADCLDDMADMGVYYDDNSFPSVSEAHDDHDDTVRFVREWVRNLREAEKKNWYYLQFAKRQGPISFSELQSLALSGELKPNDYVWREGMDEWELSSEIPGLFQTRNSKTLAVTDTVEINQTSQSDFTRTAPMAVASLVLGLVGLWNVRFLFGSILAVILGHVALYQIKQAGGGLSGRGMAVAGLILGYSAIVRLVMLLMGA